MSEDDSEDMGLWRGGEVAPREVGWGLRAYADVLPPFPDDVPQVVIPTPGPIPEGTPESRAAFLATLYFSARAAVQNTTAHGVPRSGVTRLKAYPALQRADERLTAMGIPPARWVQASFAPWLAARGDARFVGKVPTLGWTYATTRFSKPAALAAARALMAAAPTTTMHRSHQNLLASWRAAREALSTLPMGASRAAAEEAAHAHLGDWTARLDAARLAVPRYQRLVASIVDRGGWVWL